MDFSARTVYGEAMMNTEYKINYRDEDYKLVWMEGVFPLIVCGVVIAGAIVNKWYINPSLSFAIFYACFLIPLILLSFFGFRRYVKCKRKRQYNLNIIKNGKHYSGRCVVFKHVSHSVNGGHSSKYWDADVVWTDEYNVEQKVMVAKLAGYNMDEGKSKCDVYVWNNEYYVDIATRQAKDKQ